MASVNPNFVPKFCRDRPIKTKIIYHFETMDVGYRVTDVREERRILIPVPLTVPTYILGVRKIYKHGSVDEYDEVPVRLIKAERQEWIDEHYGHLLCVDKRSGKVKPKRKRK